mgnify:CR=1 FL=1
MPSQVKKSTRTPLNRTSDTRLWERSLMTRVLEDTLTGLQGLNAAFNRCTFTTSGVRVSLDKKGTTWKDYPLTDKPELSVAYVTMANAVQHQAGVAMAIAQLHLLDTSTKRSGVMGIEPSLISGLLCREWVYELTSGKINLRRLSMLYVTLDSYINEWNRLHRPKQEH